MATDDTGPLRPDLHEAEQAVDETIQQLCEVREVEKLDTAEMIRYEENLSLAAELAKKVVTLRRRIRRDQEAERESSPAPRPAQRAEPRPEPRPRAPRRGEPPHDETPLQG